MLDAAALELSTDFAALSNASIVAIDAAALGLSTDFAALSNASLVAKAEAASIALIIWFTELGNVSLSAESAELVANEAGRAVLPPLALLILGILVAARCRAMDREFEDWRDEPRAERSLSRRKLRKGARRVPTTES